MCAESISRLGLQRNGVSVVVATTTAPSRNPCLNHSLTTSTTTHHVHTYCVPHRITVGYAVVLCCCGSLPSASCQLVVCGCFVFPGQAAAVVREPATPVHSAAGGDGSSGTPRTPADAPSSSAPPTPLQSAATGGADVDVPKLVITNVESVEGGEGTGRATADDDEEDEEGRERSWRR